MATRAGLLTRARTPTPVPLTGVTIDADIHSWFARVVVSQRYVNREASAIEAVYVFPLEEGAAVCGFEAVVDGTLVVGEVRERDEAFEMYDDAMTEGHGAFLLDEERPDVFQASIGNLPPGKDVLVRITYVTELTIDDGRMRFAIPTTVSPRYAPSEDRKGVGRTDAEALNPPVAWSVPYGLNLSVRVRMPGQITAIEAPSHPISLEFKDGSAIVTLAQAEAALDRDFVLSIAAAGLDVPQAIVERTDDDGEAVAVSLVPKFATSTVAAEVIFLVDRSGSMQGRSIEEVRNALQLCLRSMSAGCYFNIVGFGYGHQALFDESRPYDQTSLDAAAAHVAQMHADLGGTVILPALASILEQPTHPEISRQVVVLTDGQVTNTDAVIALAAKHQATTRIFTFGIGAGASEHLVRGLARAGGGMAEFIYPGERIEPKVLRQFARLLSPALTDVRVEWRGGSVAQAPETVPAVFAGSRLLLYGFVKHGLPTSAHLTAASPSGPLSFDVPIGAAAEGSGRTVATLAARRRIRELEEGTASLERQNSQRRHRRHTRAGKEIIELSMRYGLMSRETSFVAIERREAPVAGDVQLRTVPIALITGWGGSHAAPMIAASMSLGSTGPIPDAAGVHRSAPGFGPPTARPSRISAMGKSLWNRVRLVEEPKAPDGPPRGERASGRVDWTLAERMQHLIELQTADGYWTLTENLAILVLRIERDSIAAAVGAPREANGMEKAWATALAITWLEVQVPDAIDQWRLVAAKAREWLDRSAVASPDKRSWLELAHEFLSTAPTR